MIRKYMTDHALDHNIYTSFSDSITETDDISLTLMQYFSIFFQYFFLPFPCHNLRQILAQQYHIIGKMFNNTHTLTNSVPAPCTVPAIRYQPSARITLQML